MNPPMPSPYSYDLRTKAIEAVERGEKKPPFAEPSGLVAVPFIFG
jgi:hypothetical protein